MGRGAPRHPAIRRIGGGPPEICGSGRASEFVATVRSIARWAEGKGAEWLVMIDPATRIDAAVTRAPLSDANGAEDKHWTKPLDAKLLAKAKEITGIDPAYRHSGLCGGSALRVKALTRGRLPKLPSLKGLDDRVDWWHDVALATYFFMNGYAIAPWGDLRENGHPGPAHGPTAFERVANGDGGTAGLVPLEGADRFLFRRVEPRVHAGHVPAGDDVFDPSAAVTRHGIGRAGGTRPAVGDGDVVAVPGPRRDRPVRGGAPVGLGRRRISRRTDQQAEASRRSSDWSRSKSGSPTWTRTVGPPHPPSPPSSIRRKPRIRTARTAGTFSWRWDPSTSRRRRGW